jgi:hypothetical protein
MALSQDSWVAIAVAAVSAVSAITAAVVATVLAAQAQKVKELETRIADRKGKLYEEIIKTLRPLLTPEEISEPSDSERVIAELKEHSTWIALYGSEDVVTAYHNIVSGAFSDPPPPLVIIFRFYADLVIAVRRDLGYQDTKVTPDQVLDARSFNLYIEGLWPALNLPLQQLYKTSNWAPPWKRAPEQWTPREIKPASLPAPTVSQASDGVLNANTIQQGLPQPESH